MAGVKITQLRSQMATGRRYGSFAGRAPTISATLTGTITASISEADIVAGGKTLILTLTNDTWVAAGATFNAQRQAILNGITSAQAEATGWNAAVRDLEVVGAVVRTSNTVVTITWTAQPLYNITAQETITATIPTTALSTALSDVVATPTFTISVSTPTAVSETGGDDAPRKHRKPKPLKDIYRDIQQTIHALSVGEPEAVALPSVSSDASTVEARQVDRAMDRLVALARDQRIYSEKIEQLQRDLRAYQQWLLDEDDADWEWFL